MSEERWRPVAGFPDYWVSNDGRVESHKRGPRGRFLKLHVDRGAGTGRPIALSVSLRRDGQTFTRKVHHLVLEAFVGPRPHALVTRHLDGDYSNNHLENLCYGTVAENNADTVRHGNHNMQQRSS